ncbi:prepilin-type N-terminal cleavage/methylation domain-containing protein [Thermodesulfovibrio sp. 3462-1]|uniref:Prepilin-type N-terminal cleavage/methylation domain-containing protein n=1 Tax=Thermodesulfovibrio obliviosus TaxID=3118332 RepID=A0AAU8H224_9BACT
MKSLRNSKGFTLVELAIVLVIIGIIIGAVLKGQELINNAKIKRAYNQYREILAAVYTYYDKYNYYPGDDPNAKGRWPSVTNGDGNGLIAVGIGSTAPNFACTGTGTEQCDLWAELRLANILTGSGFSNPRHAYGGAIAVSYYTMPAVAGGTPLLAHWIHFQNVPYDVCQAIDRTYDDGNAGAGSIRGTADYMAATSGVFQLSFKLD